MQIVQNWRKKLPGFRLQLESLLASPVPLPRLDCPPLGPDSTPAHLLLAIEADLARMSLLQLAVTLQKHRPQKDEYVNFIKSVAEQKNYGLKARRRMVWQVKRKFWPEIKEGLEVIQEARRRRKAEQKMIEELQALIQAIQTMDENSIGQVDQQFDRWWQCERQHSSLDAGDSTEDNLSRDHSLEAFVIRVEQKSRRGGTKSKMFNRLGSKQARPPLQPASLLEFEEVLKRLPCQQPSPCVFQKTPQREPGRPFVSIFDSFLVYKRPERRPGVVLAGSNPLFRHEGVKYEADSEEQYFELTGQNLDRAEQEDDSSCTESESNSFLVDDDYLSEDQLEDSDVERKDRAVRNLATKEWRLEAGSQAAASFRAIFVEKESPPLQFQFEQELKQQIPEHLIPELLGLFHRSDKYKSVLIDSFLYEHSCVSKKSVENFLKRSVRKGERGVWEVREDVARELGLERELEQIKQARKEGSKSKSRNSVRQRSKATETE